MIRCDILHYFISLKHELSYYLNTKTYVTIIILFP